MKSFDELNYGKSTVREGIVLEDMEFVPLKNFVGRTILVDGFFFTNGKYGKSVVVVGEGYKINMPKHCVEKFEAISNDDELIDAMFDGKLLLSNIKPKKTSNGETISVRYNDLRSEKSVDSVETLPF